MKRRPSFRNPDLSEGVALLDLLIVALILATIVSLVVPTMISAQKSIGLSNAAMEFSSYLQRARSDSKKLHAVSAAQMAQVTVVNDHYYFVIIDSNGDGVLDPPIVVNLETRRVQMDGPYPRTFRFDWLGRAVDSNQVILSSPEVKFSGESAKTLVKFDGPGEPVITVSK
jgi:Tfp pilus assembly protein FimT